MMSGSVHILLYHDLGDAPQPHANLDCFCLTDRFREQMEFLRTANIAVITLPEALDRVFSGRESPGPSVVLTFDDGLRSFYDIAFPILREFDLPSALFPVSGLLGQAASWIRPPARPPLLISPGELKELHAAGVEIGAHSVDHPRLSELSSEEMVWQISESKSTLESLTGSPLFAFAYPHGNYDAEVMEAVRAAGFSSALTCTAKPANCAPGPFELPRIYITFADELSHFKAKISA